MIYCFLSTGFEEIEALATVDILKRASIDVKTVSTRGKLVTGVHDIVVSADMEAKRIKYADSIKGVILPGGMPGAANLEKSPVVRATIQYCVEQNLPIAAICAAPSILGHMNLLKGKKATCYPSFESELYGAKIVRKKVVVDDNIITARGAGCTFEFAFEIVTQILGKAEADKLRSSMQYDAES